MSDESITFSHLEEELPEAFSDIDIPDFTFVDSNLMRVGGHAVLNVPGVFPGGLTVIDNNGLAVLADQSEYMEDGIVAGTAVALDGFLRNGLLPGTWRIRYNRGMRGESGFSSTLSVASSNELALYSLIFG